MSTPIRYRKVRCDAKVLQLPDDKRPLICQWVDEEGMAACLQRIEKELGFTTNSSSVYRAISQWAVEEHFGYYNDVAETQVDLEEAAGGKLTPEQREEAVDRHFVVLAGSTKDRKLYEQMRYLRIADQKAKSEKRTAQGKLEHGSAALRQKDKMLALAERKVVLLEKKIEDAKNATKNKTLSAEERAARVRRILGK